MKYSLLILLSILILIASCDDEVPTKSNNEDPTDTTDVVDSTVIIPVYPEPKFISLTPNEAFIGDTVEITYKYMKNVIEGLEIRFEPNQIIVPYSISVNEEDSLYNIFATVPDSTISGLITLSNDSLSIEVEDSLIIIKNPYDIEIDLIKISMEEQMIHRSWSEAYMNNNTFGRDTIVESLSYKFNPDIQVSRCNINPAPCTTSFEPGELIACHSDGSLSNSCSIYDLSIKDDTLLINIQLRYNDRSTPVDTYYFRLLAHFKNIDENINNQIFIIKPEDVIEWNYTSNTSNSTYHTNNTSYKSLENHPEFKLEIHLK